MRGHEMIPSTIIHQDLRGQDLMIVADEFDDVLVRRDRSLTKIRPLRVQRKNLFRSIKRTAIEPI